jgi:hypothetical protein
MKKIKKMKKNEKKIEILFGRPNSSTVFKFSGKIKSKKTFPENHKMAARVSSMFISPSNYPQENKILTPLLGIIYVLFSCLPSLSKQEKKSSKGPASFYIYTTLCRMPRFK